MKTQADFKRWLVVAMANKTFLGVKVYGRSGEVIYDFPPAPIGKIRRNSFAIQRDRLIWTEFNKADDWQFEPGKITKIVSQPLAKAVGLVA